METRSVRDLDIEGSQKILDEDHFGIEKVKTRIIQHLAVMKLKKNKKGSILLFVGPPGTGKTSLGKSIARAMQRSYQRPKPRRHPRRSGNTGAPQKPMSGHLPGRIIQSMKKSEAAQSRFSSSTRSTNLWSAYSGDPASALLEVLDPEQNNTFTDHYLEVPYDLSEVFFIATPIRRQPFPRRFLTEWKSLK